MTDEDLCTQCEYCIDVCPVSAISIVDDRIFSDPATCIKCCACVKECPEGARTFDTPYTAMLHKNLVSAANRSCLFDFLKYQLIADSTEIQFLNRGIGFCLYPYLFNI